MHPIGAVQLEGEVEYVSFGPTSNRSPRGVQVHIAAEVHETRAEREGLIGVILLELILREWLVSVDANPFLKSTLTFTAATLLRHHLRFVC